MATQGYRHLSIERLGHVGSRIQDRSHFEAGEVQGRESRGQLDGLVQIPGVEQERPRRPYEARLAIFGRRVDLDGGPPSPRIVFHGDDIDVGPAAHLLEVQLAGHS